jgi:hypothetical protein
LYELYSQPYKTTGKVLINVIPVIPTGEKNFNEKVATSLVYIEKVKLAVVFNYGKKV